MAGRSFDGQVEPRSPLIPRAVVVGQVGETEAGEVEEDHGGGDAAVAVGDDGSVGSDPGLVDPAAELIQRGESRLRSRRRARGAG